MRLNRSGDGGIAGYGGLERGHDPPRSRILFVAEAYGSRQAPTRRCEYGLICYHQEAPKRGQEGGLAGGGPPRA